MRVAAVLCGLFVAPFALVAALVLFHYVRRAAFLALRGDAWWIHPWTLVALLVREVLATARILMWNVLRRGEHLPRTAGGEPPVVLIHGLGADGTSMFALRRRLAALGRGTHAPHLGRVWRPIEAYARRLTDELDGVEGSFDVVAHSMGGIVLRAALQNNPALCARVRCAVTIASPHAGTLAALHLPLPETRQLARPSAWLSALPTLSELLPHARIITADSTTDAIVFPTVTSAVDGATAHHFVNVGHAETLTVAHVVDTVVASLIDV